MVKQHVFISSKVFLIIAITKSAYLLYTVIICHLIVSHIHKNLIVFVSFAFLLFSVESFLKNSIVITTGMGDLNVFVDITFLHFSAKNLTIDDTNTVQHKIDERKF